VRSKNKIIEKIGGSEGMEVRDARGGKETSGVCAQSLSERTQRKDVNTEDLTLGEVGES